MKIGDVQLNAELSEVLDELVLQLRANGSQLLQKRKDGPSHIQICCPYHADGMERRPSAGIRKEDGVFHCFACGEVHSLPEVISHCFGHTGDIVGKFGWQWLLKNFATVQVEERKDVELDFVRSGTNRIFNNNISVSKNERNSRCSEYNSEKYVSEEELDKYRYIHPYMYKRGLTDDIIRLFDIGFDRNTNCITFPVRDIQGRVLLVARRSVNSKYFNYPAGSVKPLYGLYELYQLNQFPTEVIVTESMLDALKFWVAGKYAVALNGLGNDLQFRQLRELPCRWIILCTDMDGPGLSARDNLRIKLHGAKLIQEYYLPVGRKDANDCTIEELKNLVAVF